jgi:transposase
VLYFFYNTPKTKQANKMFVRVKTTPNSPRKSIQIVESYRKAGKVSQKIIRHVGVAMDEEEEKQLRDMATEIIAKLEHERITNSPQTDLFDFPSKEAVTTTLQKKLGRPKRKNIEDILPTSQVTLDDIVEEARIIEGVHEVAGKVYDDLYAGVVKGKRNNKILKDLVLARLVHPSSKHKTQKYLLNQFNIEHNLDAIYRLMDKVHENIDTIKRITFEKTHNLFPEGVDLLLFDVTTLYFESVTTDELRKYGYSKDHRFNTTQLVLALATNTKGLPVGYELFEGNKAEVKTLIEAIESWSKIFNIGSVCFVGDRAMMSKDNLSLLDKHGHKYIIATKLRSLPKKLKNEILEQENYRATVLADQLAWIGEFGYENKKVIVSFKKKRAIKDAKDRQQILDKITKRLSGHADTKKLITNSGVKKYTKTTDSTTTLDNEKIEADALWDGLHGVITNITDENTTPESLIARYSSLWKIEESFRINKHTLKMRPIFHWKPQRIKAHIAICYMTFATLRNLQYQVELRQKVSLETIIDELLNVQSSIHRHKVTKDLYRLPGKFTNIAKKIYKAFDIERSLDASIYLPK